MLEKSQFFQQEFDSFRDNCGALWSYNWVGFIVSTLYCHFINNRCVMFNLNLNKWQITNLGQHPHGLHSSGVF